MIPADRRLKNKLDRAYALANRASFVDADPVRFPRP